MKGKPSGRRRHTPQRTCVICRRKMDKRQLTRVVRTPAGSVVVDPSGKQNGRGAYLCEQTTCWQSAAQGEALARALQTTLTPGERDMLRQHQPQSEPAQD